MTDDLGTAAAASAGGLLRFRRKAAHAAPLGSPCANCGEALLGPWCHACGQLGEDFHRSTPHLVAEVFEGLFHFDGRIWRTLPGLFLRPGRLTRDFLDGHRVPQIPPLRLFLVTLFLVFLVGSIKTHGPVDVNAKLKITPAVGAGVAGDGEGPAAMTPAQRAKVAKSLSGLQVDLPGGLGVDQAALTQWLRTRVAAALANPEKFFSAIEHWGERFAFLLLPMSTLLLSLVYVFQRRFYVFDHAIFSLHSLSAMGLLLVMTVALGPLTGGASAWLIALAPLHLFVHMRGVYGSSVLGTLLRMLVVFIGSLFGLILLILGLISVGLNAMG